MSDFKTKVLNLVKKIPKGKITTYKQIAIALNNPNASRAVGTVLKKNENSFLNLKIDLKNQIPCHRVIKSNGQIGHYCGGTKDKKKKEILQKEGISISNRKVNDLDMFLYKF